MNWIPHLSLVFHVLIPTIFAFYLKFIHQPCNHVDVKISHLLQPLLGNLYTSNSDCLKKLHIIIEALF
jgi:hypothetical protein